MAGAPRRKRALSGLRFARAAIGGLQTTRLRARHVALISAIALVAVSIVAVADHRSKQQRMRRASVANWFCTHRGVRCDEEESQAIGERWHRRERIYQASVALLVVIGTASFLLPAVRRRSSPNDSG
jgi:hypothetical protein